MICFNSLKIISKCYSLRQLLSPLVSHRISMNWSENRCIHKTSPKLDVMEFFDNPKNWGESEVKTGREWIKDELRIKSNSDLHKLWFVLYKERNMLKTLEELAKQEVELFPSPERIDKVEQSMKNLEEVVRERNKAFWELEVGEGTTGERPKAFRRDIFGRWRWIGCSEHIMPYRMNTKWRALNAPGFGKEVILFNRKLKEKKLLAKKHLIHKQKYYVRQLLKRFPDIDIEYLEEQFPDVDVRNQLENLDELCLQDRRPNPNPALKWSKHYKKTEH